MVDEEEQYLKSEVTVRHRRSAAGGVSPCMRWLSTHLFRPRVLHPEVRIHELNGLRFVPADVRVAAVY